MSHPHDPNQADPREAPGLIAEVLTHLSNLVRHEIALAKAELSSSASKAGLGIGLLVAAALISLAALNLLAAASVAGVVALGLGWGWAALIAAGIWFAVAAVLGLWGRSKLSPKSLAPTRTLAELRKDVSTFKEVSNA